MIDENMNYEERAILDKLRFYYDEKIEVHITLRKLMPNGSHAWLNGSLMPSAIERLWLVDERKLGEVRVSISEILMIEELKMEYRS